jgi:hypothetical protein
MKIPEDLKRHTAGHGYEAGCDCDLCDGTGGEPDSECKILPPYETIQAYIERLINRIMELEKEVRAANLKYIKHLN